MLIENRFYSTVPFQCQMVVPEKAPNSLQQKDGIPVCFYVDQFLDIYPNPKNLETLLIKFSKQTKIKKLHTVHPSAQDGPRKSAKNLCSKGGWFAQGVQLARKKEANNRDAFTFRPKLYIQGTLKIDLVFWQVQQIVTAIKY